jgi:hypothetical protein
MVVYTVNGIEFATLEEAKEYQAQRGGIIKGVTRFN